ncbi:MAG: type II toxin-antitoxin system death-on-curing family toxin [Actinobacteria bacterium]|nr:type II toxin-antitoxin system death-on-curing family toxin [Actinomycetota bacterium]
MTRPLRFLEIDDVLNLGRRLLGDPVPVRDMGLLNSAVLRPQTTFGGEYAYRDIYEMAAALLQSIVGNHALIDGNKRLGWLSTAVFLEINGVSVSCLANDQVFDLVLWVAATSPSHGAITERLRLLLAT